MANKTVIVTGANSGIGFECAKAIAKQGEEWHVVIACRDLAKGNEAASRIVAETGNKAITVLMLDLASLESIRAFPQLLENAQLSPLHGLICNAGIQVLQGPLQYTKDGFELMFGVNHLGHFLLTNLLLDKLVAPARIVIVSSATHDRDSMEGRFNKPRYNVAEALAHPKEKEMSGMARYATSKLANMLFANELDRRLKAQGRIGISVFGFDPGAVPGTQIVRSIKSGLVRKLWLKSSFLTMFGLVYSTLDKSSSAMARLLLDPALENTSGKYFQVLNEKPAHKDSFDEAKGKELWESSAELVGL